ncbi:hypothetical protein PoB_000223600 [Plakobranchus ocellatus]|uniref:PiggyBac transposable element-derived protein domain-containing protein n=1 Tax=Plakobranchus ocellatus TaxID=259542 RepID=A0AAV3Y0A0_9GAST|nr:hypothetical protein PoB_000223600 [Plakobranchus ocellatus]
MRCIASSTPFLNKGHCLYVDKYYCDPTLCQQHYGSWNSVGKSHRAATRFHEQAPATGEMDNSQAESSLYCKVEEYARGEHSDTKHLPEMVEHCTRSEVEMKPTAVIDYSASMCGVDLNNQLISL